MRDWSAKEHPADAAAYARARACALTGVLLCCVGARRSVRSPRRCACAHARMRGDPRSSLTRRASSRCCCCCYASSRRLVARRDRVAKIIAPVCRECPSLSLPLFLFLFRAREEVVAVGHAARTCHPSVSLLHSLVIHSSPSLSFSPAPSLLRAHATRPSLSLPVTPRTRTGTTFRSVRHGKAA